MSNLLDRVAVITGAGSGLGRAISLQLALEGAALLCTDRDLAAATQTAALVEAGGGRAVALAVDVTSRTATESMAEEVVKAFGSVDILVANAGVNVPGRAHEITESEWDRVLNTDLKGVWLSVKAVLPRMIAQGHGSIIAIASTAGLVGERGDAAYSAAKGGVIALARQMAVDYGDDGIRVNAVCPGLVMTPFAAEVYRERSEATGLSVEALLERAVRRYPLRRSGTPQDIAELVTFLSSDASSWMTGCAIPIDGGLAAAARER